MASGVEVRTVLGVHNDDEMAAAAQPAASAPVNADAPTQVLVLDPTELDAPRPAGNSQRRPPVTLRHVPYAVAILVVVAIITAFVLANESSSKKRTPQASSSAAVLHPGDGTLSVGQVTVTQLSGNCHGNQCQFPATANIPTVTAPAGTLPLRAGQSTVFPGVSAFNVAHPSAPAPITAGPGVLRFPSAAPGTYRVTLVGDKGGAWQFTLVVTAAPK